MLINNNHIQGIFVYSPSAEYEKGDFIVESGTLYICTATNPTDKEKYTVQGQKPSENKENFNIYLGDKIADADEFYRYIKSPDEHDDKYISSFSLNRILNSIMVGFDEKGFINEIESSEDNPLDYILNCKDINNATYNVDRDSKCIQDLGFIPSSLPSSPSDNVITPTNKIILRQYSYEELIDGFNRVIRVQELIDPLYGDTTYRWSRLDDDVVSEWKTSYPGSSSIKDKFDFLRQRYHQYIKNLEEEKKRLIGNFSYREINLGTPRTDVVVLQTTSLEDPGYIDFGKTSNEGFSSSQPKSMVLDIVIRTLVDLNGETYQKNKSLTLDLRGFEKEIEINNYYIDDQTSINVEKSSDNTKATLTLFSNTRDSKFVSIYYRKQYEYGD